MQALKLCKTKKRFCRKMQDDFSDLSGSQSQKTRIARV